jgi:hypothetical protein
VKHFKNLYGNGVYSINKESDKDRRVWPVNSVVFLEARILKNQLITIKFSYIYSQIKLCYLHECWTYSSPQSLLHNKMFP